MQPLFARSQHQPSRSLNEQINTLNQEKDKLLRRINELDQKITICEKALQIKTLGWVDWGITVVASDAALNIMSMLPNQEINTQLQVLRQEKHTAQNRIADIQDILPSLKDLLGSSLQCEKYVRIAIWNQQYCPEERDSARRAVNNATNAAGKALYSERKVECLGTTCYRQQKICCLFNVIDCCNTRCYAIDCLCCACCIWPEGGLSVAC